jgi:hypothetical protein
LARRPGGRVISQDNLRGPRLSFAYHWMHRARGGLAPALISHSHPPSSVSRQLRERSSSSSSSNKVTKKTKRAWINSGRTLLDTAAFRRSTPPKSHRATELRLVNSILDEWHLPTAAERDLQGVVPPMASDLEGCTSELPSGVGPGALVEIRL